MRNRGEKSRWPFAAGVLWSVCAVVISSCSHPPMDRRTLIAFPEQPAANDLGQSSMLDSLASASSMGSEGPQLIGAVGIGPKRKREGSGMPSSQIQNGHYSHSETSPEPSTRGPKKKKASRACAHCQKAHLTCDDCQSFCALIFIAADLKIQHGHAKDASNEVWQRHVWRGIGKRPNIYSMKRNLVCPLRRPCHPMLIGLLTSFWLQTT